MHVDRARDCDAVQGQLLVVHAPGRETGERSSDQRNKTDDEAQPNHAFNRKCRVGEGMDDTSEICRNGDEAKRDESQPRKIMKELTSGRNTGWQQATIT